MADTKPETVWVRQLTLGPMKNFIHLLGAPGGREAVVVDPAWDAPAILGAAEAEGRRLTGIVLTHHHADHLNAVPALLEVVDVPVYAQRDEVACAPVLQAWGDAVRPVGPGEVLHLAGVPVTCLHTPGHTPGSQCLWCGDALFTGDTLFVNACGRCDLPGGDAGALHRSLFEVLGRLDAATRVFPGHDYGDVPVSTLGRERAQNPYLLRPLREDFIAWRRRPRG